MRVREVRAQLHHAGLIASCMSTQSMQEVYAQTGLFPVHAIREAIRHSVGYSRLVLIDMKPLAIYGLSEFGHPVGNRSVAEVWCFGTRHIQDHPFHFLRHSKRALGVLQKHTALLTNFVDAHDFPAHKWLNFLGASYVLPGRQMGGRLFSQFILDAKVTQQCQQG